MNVLVGAIERCRAEQKASLEHLVEIVQPKLEQACRKWGFNFYTGFSLGQRAWRIDFAKEASPDAHQYIHAESGYLLFFLEPELFTALEIIIAQDTQLGVQMIPCIEITKNEYEWVVIQLEEEGTPTILAVEQIANLLVTKDAPESEYFGWVTRQVAEEIIGFKDERTFGALGYLPEIRNISGIFSQQK